MYSSSIQSDIISDTKLRGKSKLPQKRENSKLFHKFLTILRILRAAFTALFKAHSS